MAVRGLWPSVAALALGAAACSPPAARSPDVEESARPAAPEVLAAPIAPPPEAAVSPVPRASAEPPPALPISYPPRDECAGLPGFAAFRAKVFAAARARDAEALAALADPKINLDFGGGSGPDELKKRLADPKTGLWDEIATLANLGCAADGGVATLPWIFSRLPEGYDDASTAMYGTGPALTLRAGPSADSRRLAQLTWPLAELEGSGFDPKAPFAKVRLSDGTIGYIETARLRSLLDYRLIADRQDGDWKITALIAGD